MATSVIHLDPPRRAVQVQELGGSDRRKDGSLASAVMCSEKPMGAPSSRPYLVQRARSKPTAFQAVSFQQVESVGCFELASTLD